MGTAEQIRWKGHLKQTQINRLTEQIDQLTSMIDQQDTLLSEYVERQQITNDFVRDIFTSNYSLNSLTGYHPVVEQCDATPDITADGTKIDIDRAGDYKYVALSRDLLTHFNSRGMRINYGDYVLIKGTPKASYDGIYQVRDTMNERHTEWIDILLTPGDQSFYYKNILMQKIVNEEYLAILREIYTNQSEV